MLLRELSQQVQTVHDGGAALEAVREFQPEIVLLDIVLPGMDGYEVARHLRADWDSRRTMRVGDGPRGNAQPQYDGDSRPFALIALTGYGQIEGRRRALEAGFDCHLVKPVGLATLESLLEQPTENLARFGWSKSAIVAPS